MSTKENTTLKILMQALASGIVDRSNFAKKLDKVFKEVKEVQPMIPATRRPHLDSTLNVIYQSCDTEVADGKSTLLEVQVSPSESASYQWLKDGQPLSDGLAYSGVDTGILVISLARQRKEGEYVSRIRRSGEEVTSDVVTLTISFPPEKQSLILMYQRQYDVPPDTWPPVVRSPFINLALIKTANLVVLTVTTTVFRETWMTSCKVKRKLNMRKCLAHLEVESYC